MSSNCLRIIALLAVASAAHGAGDVFEQMDDFWHTVDEQFDKLGAKLDATFKVDQIYWEQPRSHVVEEGNAYKIIIEMEDVTESEIRVQTFKNIIVVNAVHEEPGNVKQYQHTQVIPPGHNKFGKWRFEKGILTLIFEKLGSTGDDSSGQHNTAYVGYGRKPLPSNNYHSTGNNGQSQENSKLPQTHQIRRPQSTANGVTVPDQRSSNNGFHQGLPMIPQNRVPISPTTIVDTSTIAEQRGNTGGYGRRKPTGQATSQSTTGQIGNIPAGAIYPSGQGLVNGAYGGPVHSSSVPEQTGQPTNHAVPLGVSGQRRGPSRYGEGGAQTNIGQPGYGEATETSDLLGGSVPVGQSGSSGYPNVQPIGEAGPKGLTDQGRGSNYGGGSAPTKHFGQAGHRAANEQSHSRGASVRFGQSSTEGYTKVQPIGQAVPTGLNGQGRGPNYGGGSAPINNVGQTGHRGASESSDSRGESVHVGQSGTGNYPNSQSFEPSGNVQSGRVPEGSSESTNQFHHNGGQGTSSSNYAGSGTQATNSGDQSGGYNDPNAFRTSIHRHKSGSGFVNGDTNSYRQWIASQSSSRAQYGLDNEGRVIPMAGQDVSQPDGINVHESRRQFHTVSETRTVQAYPDGATGEGGKRGGVSPNNERPEGDSAPESSANPNRPGGSSSQSPATKPRKPTKA